MGFSLIKTRCDDDLAVVPLVAELYTIVAFAPLPVR